MQRVGVSAGQMDQSQRSGLTLNQRADRREAVVTDDEVTLRKTEADPGGPGVAEVALRFGSLTGNVRPALLGCPDC